MLQPPGFNQYPSPSRISGPVPLPVPAPRRGLSWSQVLLILTTTGLMVAVLVLGALLLKHMAPRTNAAPAAAPVPAPAAPAPAPPSPKAPAPKARAEDARPLWTALGGLTRAHLYQSHLSIGLLADGVEEELYKLPEARKLLANITRLMDEVEFDLGQLPAAGLGAQERELLGKVRELLVLLRVQTRELRAYWDSEDSVSAARFHKARETAGGKLSELLRLGG